MGGFKSYFCDESSPWKGGKGTKGLAICRRDFGESLGYEVDVNYNYSAIKSNILKMCDDAGVRMEDLPGAQRLRFNAVLRLSNLFLKETSSWTKEYFSYMFRYVITVFASCANGVKSGLGVTFITEFMEFYKSTWSSYELNINISQYTEIMITELRSCNKENWRKLIITYDNDDVIGTSNNNSCKKGGYKKKCTSCENQGGDESETVIMQEWEEVYNEDGELIKKTQIS